MNGLNLLQSIVGSKAIFYGDLTQCDIFEN